MGNSTYDVVINNLKQTLKINKKLRIRMTVTPNNVCFLYNSVLHFIDLGVKNIVPAVDNGNQNWNKQEMQILKNQLVKIKKYLETIKDRNIYVAMTSKDDLKYKGICAGGIKSFHIDPNGDIYPCAYTVGDNFYKCGNVAVGLNNHKIQEFDKINEKKVPICEDCNYYNFCISKRCKFINKYLTGDFFKASPVVCNVEQIKLNICSIISNN